MYICQSCTMPMKKETDFGTNKDGSKNETYCCYCFKDGEFTEPNLTKDEMIKTVAEFLIQKRGFNEEQAVEKSKKLIGDLERWR
ncbi:transcriptional regulator [Candidatus Dependentiae bacterium]|nr:transcriptional regulator [Candidatus Dependentiae bacterium]